MSTTTNKSDNTERSRIEIDNHWLWYRADRDDWCVCWYIQGSRRVARRSTGVAGNAHGTPPDAALHALNTLVTQRRRRASLDPQDSFVGKILDEWFSRHVLPNLTRAPAYRYAMLSLARFFTFEQAEGHLHGPARVSDVDADCIDRLIAFRFSEGVGGHTISGDLAALRSAFMWAKNRGYLKAMPFIADVPPKLKNRCREVEYSPEELGNLLTAAARLPERQHVFLFIMIMLSTHCRVEALLELKSDQIKGRYIQFNASDRRQTAKKRPPVPISPTLAPWLEGVGGKVIQYKAAKSLNGSPDRFSRPTRHIKKAFAACLIEAGITDGLDAKMRPRPRGTPNSLRHSIHTQLQARGVPIAQIQTVAGHRTESGVGNAYTHLRPEYLREFVAAVEALWLEIDAFTVAHRRKPDVS